MIDPNVATMRPADFMRAEVAVRTRGGTKIHKAYRTDAMTFCGRSTWRRDQIERTVIDPEVRVDVSDLCGTCWRNFY